MARLSFHGVSPCPHFKARALFIGNIMNDKKEKTFKDFTKAKMQSDINKATGLELKALDRANSSDIVKLAQYFTKQGVQIEGVK